MAFSVLGLNMELNEHKSQDQESTLNPNSCYINLKNVLFSAFGSLQSASHADTSSVACVDMRDGRLDKQSEIKITVFLSKVRQWKALRKIHFENKLNFIGEALAERAHRLNDTIAVRLFGLIASLE